ncbi:TIR domain-containing protein, partial [bacterium]|nr:TIR domain-containing protein [bacterium]
MEVQNKINTEIDRTKIYKVFISYCWSSPEHENWVYDLATRLRNDGIDVIYDKWDLKAGQDKNAFMESMVIDETINKVLVICTKDYKEKADKRKGGVGTETQIITSELYDKIEQTKFIPVIAEQGEKFDSYMPVYIKNRIGFDLSKNETFEDEYEKLLRAIIDRPKYRKPKLGTLPSYLFEEENSNYKTKSIVSSFKNNLFK